MNKEEEEIIKRVMEEFNNAGDFLIAIDIVLNQIQKQEKIIDKMAEQLEKCKNEIDVLSEGNIDCFIPNEYSHIDDCIKKPTCKECIKKYFKKEVEKDVKD